MTNIYSKYKYLLPTAYFPPIEYFAILLKYNVLIEKQETYLKQTYRNRCYIYSEKGKMALTVPVKKPNGNHTKTYEVNILNDGKWNLQHWRAIESAYSASPFFLYYKDDIYPFFEGNYTNLFDFNLKIIKTLSTLLDIVPTISSTELFEKLPDSIIDLRWRLTPKQEPVVTHFPNYIQVFSNKHGFISGLSIIDLLFNLGNETKMYLSKLNV